MVRMKVLMILQQILEHLEAQQQGEFIYPQFEDYCFTSIPPAVEYLFGLRKSSPLSGVFQAAGLNPGEPLKVILLLIDGFGFRQWTAFRDRFPFLKNFTERGRLAPLTAVFPSTTSAAITTISSGVPPREHGLLEWRLYIEELDRVILTLPFSLVDKSTPRDSLLRSGADPRILFDGRTFYEKLSESGIHSYLMIQDYMSNSAYSRMIKKGSTPFEYSFLADMLVNLRHKLDEVSAPAYFNVYWSSIDSMAHEYSPSSEQSLAEMNGFFYLIQKEFIEKLPRRTAEQTVLIITADHGQVAVNPEDTIYLDLFSEGVENLGVSAAGNRILPWGSPRDLFLNIREDKLEKVSRLLMRKLKDQAAVLRLDYAVERQLFGTGPSHPHFPSRLGNLLVLPLKNNTVWFEHFKGDRFDLRGMHGGLSPDEMLIPLGVCRISELQ